MPPRKKTAEAETVTSLDDLLDFNGVTEETATKASEEPSDTTEAPEEVVTAPQAEESSETPEERRIRELEAQIEAEENRARLNPTTDDGRPVPETALTPEQKRIRELEDRLAQKRAKNLETNGFVPENAEDGVLIHFLMDGFTAQGQVYYLGQEVRFGPQAYKQTQDRYGNSWLDLDENAQIKKYGQIAFRKGPWPGNGYEDEEAAEKARRAKINAPVVHI